MSALDLGRAARAVLVTLMVSFAGCEERPRFDPAEYRAARPGMSLPQGFLLGTATSSHQIEGGNLNDWTDWEAGAFPDGRPHIRHNDQSGRAAGSWDLWRDDIAAMQRLGVNTYRLSVEWSRIEPTEGAWNAAAVARYREQIVALRGAGIRPFVTLNHFTLPRWIAARGSWENAASVRAFERFVEGIGRDLGDVVDDWITINEPNVVVVQGYLDGAFPPGVRDDTVRASNALAMLIRAHGAASNALRRTDLVDATGDGRATNIGIAHHVVLVQPASSGVLDNTIAGITDEWLNESVPRALSTGRIQLFVPGAVSIDEEVPGLRGSADFLGINFYERRFIRADLSQASLSVTYVPRERPTNAEGWDIYPEGFYRILVRYGHYGWPVYITENGLADAADAQRPDYLRGHLYAVERAIASGADIRGYFHWSLLDNFEWASGFEPRFGLFEIDYGDPLLTRRMRPSGEVFREVARDLGLRPTP